MLRWILAARAREDLTLRFEPKGKHVILTILLVAMISLSTGSVVTSKSLVVVAPVKGLVVGPIQFVEVYFLAGQDSERRSPRVGEELTVKARIQNVGPVAIHYFPTLCDSSLSAGFDPSYVRVETGRPRCLAASILTALNPGEETTVWAPESGTAYVAIRSGPTTVTAIFTYNTDAGRDPSTEAEARSIVPITIEAGSTNFSIPGPPIESIAFGIALALWMLLYRRRNKAS